MIENWKEAIIRFQKFIEVIPQTPIKKFNSQKYLALITTFFTDLIFL